MYKIGEFSKITQISVRMLRYYDEHKLLVPEKVDSFSGYRMYSAAQIDDLNRIILLKNMGLNVKEIGEIISKWDDKALKDELLRQLDKTRENIKAEQERLVQIQGFLKDLENQHRELNIQIVIKKIPSYHVVSIRRTVDNYYCESELWRELGEKLNLKECSNYCFSIYHDTDYREENVDIEVCMVTDNENYNDMSSELKIRDVEGCSVAACFMIYGPYSNISLAYKEFAFWLEQHPEYSMTGENRQICHVSQCNTDSEGEYVTELQIPLDSHMV